MSWNATIADAFFGVERVKSIDWRWHALPPHHLMILITMHDNRLRPSSSINTAPLKSLARQHLCILTVSISSLYQHPTLVARCMGNPSCLANNCFAIHDTQNRIIRRCPRLPSIHHFLNLLPLHSSVLQRLPPHRTTLQTLHHGIT